MAEKKVNRHAEIVLACSENHYYMGEKVLMDHALVRIVSGEVKVIQADRSYTFGYGDTFVFPKNQLSTMIKYPKDGLPYKSVVMNLTTSVLKTYYSEQKLDGLQPRSNGLIPLDRHPLLESFFASVIPYFDLESSLPEKIVLVKIEEAIEILRAISPGIDEVLADFSESGKIDLADFMEKNYMFNIPLEKFSSLTGRSLTTFKRDFKKTFRLSPQRWLIKKRLELAHYQLSEKRRRANDVYLETGFENLSHFSHAFKKHFGYPPTKLTQNN